MSDKKKSGKVEQDESTLKIPGSYKRKCESNGIVPNKVIRDKVDVAIEEGKLQTMQMWEDLGPIQIRAFMETLTDLNYQHLKKIRFWKVNVEDEGLRAICNYIEKVNTIEYLDLMDNKITALGCEFLSRVLVNPNNRIAKLKLDNNPITTEGLANLAVGLRNNSTIEKLSFKYCNIDARGMKYIQEIMANIDCKLRSLKLQGNPLGNEGAYELLRSVSLCGDGLQKLNIGDIGMNLLNYEVQIGNSEEEMIAKEILYILQKNVNIAKYNFRNNFIPDDVAKLMIDMVRQNKNIFIIDLPDCIAHELKELHADTMKKRKPKKKKKKGAKKSKKK